MSVYGSGSCTRCSGLTWLTSMQTSQEPEVDICTEACDQLPKRSHHDHDDSILRCTEFTPGKRSAEDVVICPPAKRRLRTAARKSWGGHYCCVPLCRNASGQNLQRESMGLPKLTFHSLPPVSNQRQRKVWLARIRRDVGSEFVLSSTTKICSAHFVDIDFSVQGKRRFLKQAAIPSIFPWTASRVQRSSTVSEAAAAPLVLPSYASSCGSTESEAHNDELCEEETHTQEDKPDHYEKLQKELKELQSENERLKSENENLITGTRGLTRQLRQKEAAHKKNFV